MTLRMNELALKSIKTEKKGGKEKTVQIVSVMQGTLMKQTNR